MDDQNPLQVVFCFEKFKIKNRGEEMEEKGMNRG